MKSSKDEYLLREIRLLATHRNATCCSVSSPVEWLRECHLQRGFRDIDYHLYITRDGVLHHYRPVSEIGAHMCGFNRCSIGVCYKDGLDESGRLADIRATTQCSALLDLLTILKHRYPGAQIFGHYQLNATIHKACPYYDPRKEYLGL